MKRIPSLTLLLIFFLVCRTASFSQYSWNEVYSDIVYPYNSTQIAAITQSPAGNNGRKCGVTLYDPLFLSRPEVADISSKCANDATAKGKLVDPPANATITVSLDGTPISFSASDNTFTYFTSGVTSPGNHTISVKYTNGVNIVQKDSVYTVNGNVTPAISISGNLIVKPGQSTDITLSATHPGTAPGYQWQDSVNSSGWQNIPSAQGTVLTYTPAKTGDKVRCILNSNADCKLLQYATSQPVQFTVNAVTAVEPVPSNKYGIRVYPNPASSTLTIDSLKVTDKWQTLVIQSIDGRKVFAEQNISNRTIVSQTLTGLRKGIYIISLRKKNGAGAFFKLEKM